MCEFNGSSRRQMQIEKWVKGDVEPVLLPGLKAEMEDWKFPLHFIDFETSTVVLPFTKGCYPYETTAFQYSHHQLDADGSLSHTEWISTDRVFPNFDFVRALKCDLEGDSGTIFRYSHHPTIGAEFLEDGETTESEDRINNGGLANANYAKLQYDGLSDDEKLKLKNALLRYCELDTMAMVLIYKFFKL